ncbi:quaternary ammonium compound efflux SMR transporter SugE [Fulvimarina sp. MAC8]|uniref:quaternary ammonium compound efflux SMR transporter SugE n=1 Tax=Fulvimarina sp. MAC8 TaxID=3162874 RepID=UPI0032EBBA46
MSWLLLIFAGTLEIGWALGMKYSEGFTRPVPSVVTGLLILLSLFLLNLSLKDLPVGTAYAVWAGIGTVGTAVMGIFLFAESASPSRLLCIAMIVLGIVGLRFLSEG